MLELSDKLDNNGTPRGKLIANSWNNRAKEEENVVTVMGVALDGASTVQLAEGVDYIAKMQLYVDTGGVNVVVASNRADVAGIETPNLKPNMTIKVVVRNTNNGASTLNYNGFGVTPIIDETGLPLSAGAMVANKMYEFYYNGASWVISGNPVTVYSGTTRPTATTNPSGVGAIWVDESTGQAYVCTDSTPNANVWKNITDVRHYDVLTAFDLNEEVLSDEGVFYQSLIGLNKGKPLDDRTSWYQLTSKPLLTPVVFNVPADFPSVTEAISHITRCYYPIGGNISARVLMGAGYQMNEQIFIIGLNLGWIELAGVDGITVTDANQYVLATPSNLRPLFYANTGATLPVIAQQFSMINGTVANGNHGVLIEWNSNVSFNGAGGVRNAGGDGLVVVFGSSATGASLDFSNAGRLALSVGHGSTFAVLYANLTGAGDTSVQISGGSSGTIEGSNCTGAVNNGIWSTGVSDLMAKDVNCRMGGVNSPNDCRVSTGGTINFDGGTGGTIIAPNTLSPNGIIYQ